MTLLEAGEQFFETTSDEFFDNHAPAVLAAKSVHVALIDGLHEFRQVLRDLTNLERYMRRDGVAILDDCNPRNAKKASDKPIGGAWNGDVWKVPAYLLVERPDLEVATIDADQGIGLVTGFEGVSTPWDEVVIERYKALPYEYVAADRARVLNLLPRSQFDALLP